MQEGIHPEYGPAVFYDRSADKYFLTKSTFLPYAATCRGEPPFYGVHRIRSGQARQGRHRGSTAPAMTVGRKAQLDKKRQTIGNAGDLMGVNAAYADKAGAGSATATTVQRHFNDRKKPSRKWTTGPRITRCP